MIQSNDTDAFIVKYTAALNAKLTRAEFADIVGIAPATVTRRRLTVKKERGKDMAQMPVESAYRGDVHYLDRYDVALTALLEKYKIKETISTGSAKKVFVITSAQNETPIHEGFFSSLLTYCEHRNAELMVVPYRYKNPTSIWTENNKESEYWDVKLEPYLCSEDTRIADTFRVMGHIKTQPTAQTPLSGFDSYTGLDSAVFGHPKIQLKTVAAPSQDLPKILLSTGAVTLPNYTDSKTGHIAHFHHSIAAVIVEVEDGGQFHVRHIHGDTETGHFYDLNKFYTTTHVTESERVAAVVMGDIHAEYIDEDVEDATYHAEDSIVNVLKPRYLVYHDITDFSRRNHHNTKNDLLNFVNHHNDIDNVEEGLQYCADFIDRTVGALDDTLAIIVRSNHDEAFDRWLRESEPKLDMENAKFYHYMKYNQYAYATPTPTGYDTIDALEFWCENPDQERGLECVDKVKFLKRDESFVVNGVEIGFHGDVGANGARGSAGQFAKSARRTIIGHSHSPNIIEGCYQVGTSSRMDLSYKKGLSSWLHTHAIIYPDGKRTLVNVISGKWKI